MFFKYENDSILKAKNSSRNLKFKLGVIVLTIIVISFIFYFGILVGMKVQPRSILSLNKCQENCWEMNEVAGLISSIGISMGVQKIVLDTENDTCFSIKMPTESPKKYYVIVPKQDIKDISDLDESKLSVVDSCLKIIQEIIIKEKMETCQLTTNGPNYQHIRYLHFHLKSLE
jgi:hypothetical protein